MSGQETELMDIGKGLFVANFNLLPTRDQSDVRIWWERRARARVIEIQEQGDEPLAEYVWELRRLVRRAESPKESTTADEPDYPLWCIDRGVRDKNRYMGPFTTLAETRASWCNDTEVWVISRCRRITAEEVGVRPVYESLIKEIAERTHGNDVYKWTWANWGDEVVRALDMKAAQDALAEWAQTHLEFAVYTCEPDAELKELEA
jgi:hypothetical protein